MKLLKHCRCATQILEIELTRYQRLAQFTTVRVAWCINVYLLHIHCLAQHRTSHAITDALVAYMDAFEGVHDSPTLLLMRVAMIARWEYLYITQHNTNNVE